MGYSRLPGKPSSFGETPVLTGILDRVMANHLQDQRGWAGAIRETSDRGA